MIKQSFLRNYSLIKIYNQAQDEKNKLKVFYRRQVSKIMKEKKKKERLEEMERLAKENREERVKGRFRTQVRAQFKRVKTEQNQSEWNEKEGSISDRKTREKVQLRIVDLKMEDCGNNNWDVLMKNEKISNILRQSFKDSGSKKVLNGQNEENFMKAFGKNKRENTCESDDIRKNGRNFTCTANLLQADFAENLRKYSRPQFFKKHKENQPVVKLFEKSKFNLFLETQH